MRLIASYKGEAKELAASTIIRGDVYSYQFSGGSVTQVRDHTAVGTKAKEISANIFGSLMESRKRQLVGKAVEVQIFPSTKKLTDLPDFADLDDENTGGEADRDYSSLPGTGGILIEGTNRIATPISAVELDERSDDADYPIGYVLTHELGHTVLDFAAPDLEPKIDELRKSRIAAQQDFLGTDSYTRSTVDEYWAEGTAALFNTPIAELYINEYTGKWLTDNDAKLLAQLKSVYLK
ncbi:hypothetical protein [Streptomyces cinereoruber]|uniref:hypothetical protein n=1 Tax=Streptomyces cinereoruber TaxID=67260 RepID=UPI0036366AAD